AAALERWGAAGAAWPDDGAPADLDGGDQHRARADAGVVADRGGVLDLAVEVRGDGPAAEVDVLADAGVAQVGQVAGDGAGAEGGTVDLDERADFHAVGQLGAGAEVGERAELAADAHLHRAVDDGERPDDGVAAEDGAAVDVGVAGIDDRDPLGHPVVLDPGLHELGGLGQVLAGVDAEDVVGREDVEGDDLAAHVVELLGGVGQVVFALGVAGADLLQGVPQDGQLEDVAARVDLADGLLLGGAVALLDDPEEPPGGVAEDAAEAGGVVDLGGPQQAGGPLVGLAVEEVGQGLGAEQGLVADEDQDRPLVAFQQGPADLHRVARAELFGLDGEPDGGLAVERLVELIGRVADDHDDGLRAGAAGRVDDVAEHRPAADLVQHLRPLGLHPLALAGRQDDRHRSFDRHVSAPPSKRRIPAVAPSSPCRLRARAILETRGYGRQIDAGSPPGTMPGPFGIRRK
ncbi:hypothetical protein HK102_003908, partial [Quaeritorhiza haematococci]